MQLVSHTLNGKLALHSACKGRGYTVLHVVTGIPILANIRFLGVAEDLMEDLVKEDWGFRTPDSPKIQEVFAKIQERLDKVLIWNIQN